MPNHYPDRELNAPDPPSSNQELLRQLTLGGVAYSVSDRERAEHGRDWWPITIPEVARGRVPLWPGVVVHPTSTSQVSDVLRIANSLGIAVTAQGGRSGVTGGALAPAGAVALDLTTLDRIVAIDAISGTVSVEAGVFGPELEAVLTAAGLTLGHFPQSFALSTVGGWLACRGAGQYSNRYGKIEDIVRGLTVVLASGEVVHVGGPGPRQATGPDLVQLFVGSEGTLGVITEATLVVRTRPDHEQRRAFCFSSFDDGLDSCRRILQRGAHPAVLRLYDERESARHFDVEGCALLVLDEGDPLLVGATIAVVDQECTRAAALNESVVAKWLAHRNDVGSLGELWERGLVVDTMEVAGRWAHLKTIQARVRAALEALPETIVVTVHQSHAYSDGACLYFTFAGRPEGDPTSYYRRAWDGATYAALDAGASLSHHHGVGRNRARFMSAALGSAFPLLQSLKSTLDPTSTLNPGVLGLGGEAW